MDRTLVRKWVKLVALAKADPAAQLRCPKNDDGFLDIAKDEHGLVLACPNCGAGTEVRLVSAESKRAAARSAA